MGMPTPTPDEYSEIATLIGTMDTLARAFEHDETPAGLRMEIATIRRAADVLEALADRWESSE